MRPTIAIATRPDRGRRERGVALGDRHEQMVRQMADDRGRRVPHRNRASRRDVSKPEACGSGRKGIAMTNLVLLNQERSKKVLEGQQRMVEGLEDLLRKAKAGELKGLCYASIEVEDDTIVLGVLHADNCGLHERSEFPRC